MRIYVMVKYVNGEPQIKGVTSSKEIADRWVKTTSYIKHDIHASLEHDTDDAVGIVVEAEKIEQERAEQYG